MTATPATSIFHRPASSHLTRPVAIALAMLLVSLLAGCRRGGGEPVATTRAGDLTLSVVLEPETARLQDNTLVVAIRDTAGQPVDGAELEVVATMPAMGAMSAMRSKAVVTAGGDGRYRAELDLGMSGTWALALRIKSPAGEGEANYSLTVGSKGLQPAGATAAIATPGQEVGSGEIIVSEGRRQRIGIRTGLVERQRVVREIRAVGRVTYDEAGLAEVSVKYPGWIERLYVNTTGQPVKKGQTLFTLYSPELYAAQSEFLTFLRSQQTARQTAAPERSDYLVSAARQRLRLWDLQDWQIDQIAKNGKPARHQPIVSPVSGYVIEKKVVTGAAVEPGMTLFRIAALDWVWVEADLPESELPLIEVGQKARVTLPYLPGEAVTGKVAFIFPYLDAATRTGRVRIELHNRDLLLKPDMFADVSFQIDSGERLVVPESAVLFAGPRRLVFLDLGEGRLKPLEIQIGSKSGGFLEVLSGLQAGDLVVTSGTFLVAAESRLKSATEQWQ